MSKDFAAGYHAGVVNDRTCPFSIWFQLGRCFSWYAGNDLGVRVHCAIVEAVYLHDWGTILK